MCKADAHATSAVQHQRVSAHPHNPSGRTDWLEPGCMPPGPSWAQHSDWPTWPKPPSHDRALAPAFKLNKQCRQEAMMDLAHDHS